MAARWLPANLAPSSQVFARPAGLATGRSGRRVSRTALAGSEAKCSPVHRGAAHAEDLGELGLASRPQVVPFEQVPGLGRRLSFGCLPRSRPLALATFMPSR